MEIHVRNGTADVSKANSRHKMLHYWFFIDITVNNYNQSRSLKEAETHTRVRSGNFRGQFESFMLQLMFTVCVLFRESIAIFEESEVGNSMTDVTKKTNRKPNSFKIGRNLIKLCI